jgi:nitroreductase
MENLTAIQRPSLIKKRWHPKSFSARLVEPEKLHALIDAARRTPSHRNEQPWNFIIAMNHDANFNDLLGCLPETNIAWARHAPVLILSVAKLNFDSDGLQNKYAFRDLARAVSNAVSQASTLGLQLHQIAGFDASAARLRLQIPEGHVPVEEQSSSRDELQEDGAPGLRRSIESIAFAGRWGEPASLPVPQPCP